MGEFGAETLIVGGGVACNKFLREALTILANELQISLYISEISHSTDNALMIATAGAMRSITGNLSSREDIKAEGTLRLDDRLPNTSR